MSIYAMRNAFAKYMKPILYLIVGIFVAGAAYQFGMAPRGQQRNGNGKDTTIATVNGDAIMQSEFDPLWQQTMQQARQQGIRSPLQFGQIRSGIFTELMNNRLMLQAAKRLGVDISDNAVKNEVEKQVVDMLKASRRSAMGDVSPQEEATDPRQDSAYKRLLSEASTSIADQEDYARSQVSETKVRAQMAQEGLMAKIKSGTKPVTDDDVRTSYNVYNIRQIVMEPGKLSAVQLSSKADKIAMVARGNTDFAELAKANSDMSTRSNGGKADYSFDTRFIYPPEVRDAIEHLKQGEVAGPIKTRFGYFIVKLEGMQSVASATLDKKTMDKRRQLIAQDRQQVAASKLQSTIGQNPTVDVMEPEFRGYWLIAEAQRQAASNGKLDKTKLAQAALAFSEAMRKQSNNDILMAQLAQVHMAQGNTTEAIATLRKLLDSETSSVESADLRIMLGDLLTQSKDTDEAVKQYQSASEDARWQAGIHRELVKRFRELGKSDLAANELKLAAKSEEMAKLVEQRRTRRSGATTPRAK